MIKVRDIHIQHYFANNETPDVKLCQWDSPESSGKGLFCLLYEELSLCCKPHQTFQEGIRVGWHHSLQIAPVDTYNARKEIILRGTSLLDWLKASELYGAKKLHNFLGNTALTMNLQQIELQHSTPKFRQSKPRGNACQQRYWSHALGRPRVLPGAPHDSLCSCFLAVLCCVSTYLFCLHWITL